MEGPLCGPRNLGTAAPEGEAFPALRAEDGAPCGLPAGNEIA